MQSYSSEATIKDCLILIGLTLLSTILVWLPHLLSLNFYGLDFSNGFTSIYRNYDGLEYVIIAKSWYYPHLIAGLPQSLPAHYFAAHFPGYSLAILVLAPLLGFLKSMLAITVLSTIGAVIAFYFLVRDFRLTDRPLLLSAIFLVLPARWLIVHSVGSSEPLFIFFVLLVYYWLMKFEVKAKNWQLLLAGVFGFLAMFTRPPGSLLMIALFLYIHWKAWLQWKKFGLQKFVLNHLRYFPLLLIPLALLMVFGWYAVAYTDFWAYFHSGDNIHLAFPPFQVFNKDQYWVGDIWLEDIIYILGVGYFAGVLLWKKKLYPMAFFVLTYVVASSLVAHRDISRYTLPMFPFVLISFEKALTSKEFKIVLAILLLAIYLYSQNYILHNTAPYENISLFN